MEPVRVAIATPDADQGDSIANLLRSLEYEPLAVVSTLDACHELVVTRHPDIVIADGALQPSDSDASVSSILRSRFDLPVLELFNPEKPTSTDGREPHEMLPWPVHRDELQSTMETALHTFSQLEKQRAASPREYVLRDSLFVKHQSTYRKVHLSQVRYLKSDHVYVELHTIRGDKWLVRSSLNRFMNILPDNFVRIHRSFVANLDFVDTVETNKVALADDELPVARNYRTDLLQRIKLN